jgi:regulator of extracellular matrix RemA (YlzA/DUF370 family)
LSLPDFDDERLAVKFFGCVEREDAGYGAVCRKLLIGDTNGIGVLVLKVQPIDLLSALRRTVDRVKRQFKISAVAVLASASTPIRRLRRDACQAATAANRRHTADRYLVN